MKITVKTSDGKKFSEARLGNAQDKVLKGYKKRFELIESEARNLHMFFSPNRVPKGLTKDEVRVVLFLSFFRDSKCDPALPSELTPTGRMTRGNFGNGVVKLLKDMFGK